jgi:hypothetical protein
MMARTQETTQSILRDMQSLRRKSDQPQEIPASAIPWFVDGNAPNPAHGTQITLCTYQVQIGYTGYLQAVMCTELGDGGTFIQGSGDILWTIDVDIPLGNPLATGYAVPGYALIKRSLGSLEKPWPICRGWKMHPGETYRLKAKPVANVPVGSPAFVFGSLQGVVWTNC